MAAGFLGVTWAVAVVAAQVGAPASVGMIVDLRDDVDDADVREFATRHGIALSPNSEFRQDRVYLAESGQLDRLAADPLVEAVEPNFVYGIPAGEDVSAAEAAPVAPTDGKSYPDDPMYKSQWHLDMIHMPAAWKAGKGKGAVVAVIDTGVSDGRGKLPRVPDLEGTVFTGGYDFVNDTRQPDDDHGHGTHVAGTIAQRTHNAFGVAGVAPAATIMPLKVLSKQGWGTAADIAQAIRWAADNGAHVINMSLGGGGYSDVMARAVKYAHDKGVAVICAAGNTGRGRVEYPAAYPGALAVSAVGPDGKRAWYSSYGKETFIAAPGGDTRVDLNKDGIADGVLQDTIAPGDPMRHGFYPYQGTSMATPHVAGVAALLVARGVKSPDKVAELLAASASRRAEKNEYGNGVLDAGAAMKAVDANESARVGGLAMGAALLAFLARGRRRALGVAGVMAAWLFGVGVGPVASWLGADVSWLGAFAGPVLSWDAGVLGGLTPWLASFAVPLGLVALLFGIRGARGALLGMTLGSAVFLVHAAVLGMADVVLVPGTGVLDAMWLGVNGLATLGLAAMLARRRAGG